MTKKYTVQMTGRKNATIASVIPPQGGHRRPPQNAKEALYEYAARHGWHVGSLTVDAETRGRKFAECYMDEAGAHKGFAVAIEVEA
jgi:ribosomal protein S18 acetylase RimI-like enzyme